MTVLAHGSLGSYDELIVLGAFLLVFVGVLIAGWLMSRRNENIGTRHIDNGIGRDIGTDPPRSS